jgi:two-component system, cell cycle sensor histidine kinase and response regulator CckA
MDGPLRLLLVEDTDADALLILRALKKMHGVFEHRVAASPESIVRELRAFKPQIALTDHHLQGFTGHDALQLILAEAPGTAVIVVTGSLSEEGAADYIKAGATDFVLKDNLHRLEAALTRALMLASAHEKRQLAEERLRAGQERQRAFFAASPLPMWIYDRGTLAIVDVNDRAIQHYGYSREEFLERTIRELRPAEELARFDAAIAINSQSTFNSGIWKHRKKDGSIIDVDVHTTDLTIEGRHLRLAALNDITEQRRVAAEMEESQRMEAIGRLAGGVSHDFNNLLTVIEASTEFLLTDHSAEGSLRDDIELIRNAAREAAALTRQLLTFSRRQVLAPTVLDINAFVPETTKMLVRLLGARVTIRTMLEPALGQVRLDPGHVQQILVNLAVNARDAMPHGGTITIETENISVSADIDGRRDAEASGDFVVLRVTDTGVGMDAATRARIFEPFFTTKERGKGTGLGLATVYGIVQQSGGTIRVRSAIGEGSSFEIRLPRVWAPLDAERPTRGGEARSPGTESVLIAEDDEVVRRLLVRILRAEGYRVFDAANAIEAIRFSADKTAPIDLLLTDIVMPGISGPELARRLRENRPSLQVLFVSGYVEDDVTRDEAVQSGDALLQKPFGNKELALAVRRALDARRA